MGINTTHYGLPLQGPEIWIEGIERPIEEHQITATKRVGIDYSEGDKDLPWRFYLSESKFISKK